MPIVFEFVRRIDKEPASRVLPRRCVVELTFGRMIRDVLPTWVCAGFASLGHAL